MEKRASIGAQQRKADGPVVGRGNSPVMTPKDQMFRQGQGPLDARTRLDLGLIKEISEFAGFELKTS